jgi:hypothetical protein
LIRNLWQVWPCWSSMPQRVRVCNLQQWSSFQWRELPSVSGWNVHPGTLKLWKPFSDEMSKNSYLRVSWGCWASRKHQFSNVVRALKRVRNLSHLIVQQLSSQTIPTSSHFQPSLWPLCRVCSSFFCTFCNMSMSVTALTQYRCNRLLTFSWLLLQGIHLRKCSQFLP